jgi:DNA-binding FadR family transcriptional regulator
MVKTPSRSALLARDLLGRIARRELRPGDPIDLPTLGRRHGVSRTVVREALADLGGKGLIVARPKVGTTIAPESEWNLLDPVLVAAAIAEPGPDSMLAEASDLRRVIEPALAADAARDAGRPQHAAILDAVRALAGAVGSRDRDAWARADATLHAAIADACGNRLLRSVDHALVPVRTLHRRRLLDAQPSSGPFGAELLRVLALQSALGLAIVRRDPSRASALALSLASDAGHRLGAPHRPASPAPEATPAGSAALPALPTGPTPARFTRTTAEDWPATETLVRAPDPFAPLRRATLEPEANASSLVVPALVGDAPREPASRVGLH